MPLWVILVALQIAYLPGSVPAFSQREALVAMLESRAGVPAWAELLARHRWSGLSTPSPTSTPPGKSGPPTVAESHTTYPVMLMFRSPEPWFSWLRSWPYWTVRPCTSPSPPPTASSNARLCLRMGFTCPGPDRLPLLGWHLNPDPLPEAPYPRLPSASSSRP